MNRNQLLLLKVLATSFREALERARDKGSFSQDAFNLFPKGCCGDTSNLLAQFLLGFGIHSNYIYGEYSYEDPEAQSQSHAWLQCQGGIIIDITGDQFSDRPEFFYFDTPVFVGKIDRMHIQFKTDSRNVHSAGIENLDRIVKYRLQWLYSTILNEIGNTGTPKK